MSTMTIDETAPDLQQRLRDPVTAQALDHILERLEPLARLADAAALLTTQLPGGVAMLVDSADEIAARLEARGVDLGKGLTHGSEAALRFGAIMDAEKVASLEALLRSGILDAQTVGVVGRLGDALAHTTAAPIEPVGPIGALRALRDPDVQRALGFLIGVAKHFGDAIRSGPKAGVAL